MQARALPVVFISSVVTIRLAFSGLKSPLRRHGYVEVHRGFFRQQMQAFAVLEMISTEE